MHNDEEAEQILQPILPRPAKADEGADLLRQFERHAEGPRITKPKHIFLLFLESHAQCLFDPLYDKLNLMEGSKAFRSDPHTISMSNFLPGNNELSPNRTSISAKLLFFTFSNALLYAHSSLS